MIKWGRGVKGAVRKGVHERTLKSYKQHFCSFINCFSDVCELIDNVEDKGKHRRK